MSNVQHQYCHVLVDDDGKDDNVIMLTDDSNNNADKDVTAMDIHVAGGVGNVHVTVDNMVAADNNAAALYE